MEALDIVPPRRVGPGFVLSILVCQVDLVSRSSLRTREAAGSWGAEHHMLRVLRARFLSGSTAGVLFLSQTETFGARRKATIWAMRTGEGVSKAGQLGLPEITDISFPRISSPCCFAFVGFPLFSTTRQTTISFFAGPGPNSSQVGSLPH